jgi:hypothetical protein
MSEAYAAHDAKTFREVGEHVRAAMEASRQGIAEVCSNLNTSTIHYKASAFTDV